MVSTEKEKSERGATGTNLLNTVGKIKIIFWHLNTFQQLITDRQQ